MLSFRYDDDEWYRAEVIRIDEQEASVFFCDYGNTDIVSLNRIFPADEDLLVLPMQAERCTLVGISPPDGSFSEEAIERFQDLFLEKKLLAHVVSIIEGDRRPTYALRLLNVGMSVAEKLIKDGHAVASDSLYCEFHLLKDNLNSTELLQVNQLLESSVTNGHEDETGDIGVIAEEMLSLPLNEEVEVIINCVHIPRGIFDVYPSDQPHSDVSIINLNMNSMQTCNSVTFYFMKKLIF